jgi:general transcription factor 3C polypeptide 3 (transcription factor C subunit 4)
VELKLGQAALDYTSGNYNAAAQLLNEVIRLAPTVPDAYTLLSSVHEARGDERRALDFAMIGAHLSPRDAEGWRALAERASGLDDARTAIYCLTRVLRCEPGDAHARWDRAMLYAEVGEPRKALEGVEALRVARPDDGDVARAAAKLHHALGAPERAEAALAELEAAGVADFSDLFLAAANAFWAVGDARRALRFLQPLRALPEFDAPALWSRMATCFAEVRDPAGAAAMYEDVLARHPRNPDAASALAELLLALGRTQDALAQLAPLEAGAGGSDEGEEGVMRRLRAARLRGQAGDAGAFLATALPLVRQSLRAERDAAEAAIAAAAAGRGRRGGRRAKPRPDAAAPADGVFLGYVTKPKKRGRKPAATAGEGTLAPLPPPEPPAIRQLLLDPERFALFRAVCTTLLGAGRLDEVASLVADALALGRAPGRERLAALRQLAADVAEARGDAAGAAEAMRSILSAVPPPGGSVAQWNAYSRAAAAAGATARHARALARLGSRHPGSVPCAVMGAAATAAAQPRGAPGGGWGPALPSLFRAFAAAPRAPLVSLALGTALAQHAGSRAAADRGAAALASAAFVSRYAQLRGAGSAEAAFNAARAMHALGLAHLAAPLYEAALERGDAEAEGNADDMHHRADVRREAAHNLHLLYAAAGATHLARQLLRRFATV